MKHRFLLHELNHTFLVVDITEIGIPDFIIEAGGHEQSVPSIRFKSWSDAEAYLSKLGAKPAVLLATRERLTTTSIGVLTVP